MYRDSRHDDPKELPDLTRIVRALQPDVWDIDPTRALLNVVRSAVSRLPDTAHPPGSAVSWRAMGQTVCGLRTGLPPRQNGQPYGYQAYVEWFEEESGLQVAPRTLRRILAEFRDRLAGILEMLEREAEVSGRDLVGIAAAASVRSGGPADGRTSYVSRPAYEHAFQALIEQGVKVVALVGEAGCGKSRLAAQLVRGDRDQRTVYLRSADEKQALLDMTAELARNGASTTGLAADEIVRAFAGYLCSSAAPAYVVLDNLVTADLAETLAHPETSSRIVITSREDLLPAGMAAVLIVKDMEPEEARSLAVQLLGPAGGEEAALLARALHGRPLAITHAAALVDADGAYSVADLCTDLEISVAGVLSRVPRPIEETLSHVYRRTIETLEQDERSVEALWLWAVTARLLPSAMPTGLVRAAFTLLLPEDKRSLSGARFAGALRELQRRCLVESKGDEIFVHPLTHRIVRSHFSRRWVEDVCIALLRAASSKVHRASPTADPLLAADTMSWTMSIIAVISVLPEIEFEKLRECRLPIVFLAMSSVVRRFANEPVLDLLHSKFDDIFHHDEWRSDADFKEARRDHLNYLFANARVSEPEYLLRIIGTYSRSLEGTNDIAITIKPDVARAWLAVGEPETAAEWLLSVESADRTAPEQIDYLTAVGEAHVRRGEWRSAMKVLLRAIEISESEPDLVGRLLTHGRAVRELVECLLLFGRQPDEAWEDLRALASGVSASDVLSNFDAAYAGGVQHALYLRQAMARVTGARFVVSWIAGDSEEAALRLAEFDLHADTVLETYRAIGKAREIGSLHYDVTIIDLLRSSGGSRVADCRRSAFENTFARIAVGKYLVLLGNQPPELANLWGTSRHWERLSWEIAEQTGSPYWYCEAAAVMCAIDAQQGRVRPSVMAALKADYAAIERSDRYARLANAIDSVDNRREFLNHYRFLLLP
ncbi:hypothetical protein [Actinoplanes sp. NPDC026619]|uniref:hypothetical protein n=1 Tax=Actinoplanes sp. NPDC026619 TaxID=3155798 RepID=UPI0033F4CE25